MKGIIMIHAYTFGTGSKQFLILTPRQADLINRFTDAFYLAQKMHLKKNGHYWTPQEKIQFYFNDIFTEKDMDRYNVLAGRLDRQHKIRNKIFHLFRIDVRDEEIDDHLIKRI